MSFPVMQTQRHSWFSGRGASHFRDVGCDHGAVVKIGGPKIIQMIQIDVAHQSSEYLTAYHVCFNGEERSHARVDDADHIELPII